MLKLKPPHGNSPSWEIRGTYLGRHVKVSTRTSKRAVAIKALRQIEHEIESGKFDAADGQTFAGAALGYMNAGGERIYLGRLLAHFGECPLADIGQQEIDAAALALYPDGTPATRNRSVYTPISAVLRHAGARLDLRRPKGSAGKRATVWLWPEQAGEVFAAAAKLDVEFGALLILLCYTGLRLSEALGLEWVRVREAEAYALVPDTKTGEPRGVFLPAIVVAALAGLPHDRGRVFRWQGKNKSLYGLLRGSFAAAAVPMPSGAAFHLFRHTYATWLRRYAGLDAAGLVATGAWKDAKSAARYAHVVVSEEAGRAALLPVPPSVKRA